ncbi:GNAT family N-acetyltransferase [Halococcoides cellulosivorans]|uniref:GNAT family N-acetyltransferase n=1 Tax=Halococcoides cellulosivorans TaxID=1679096 RepID=A0A2R4X1J5_9EURY|nr:GNAT family N-acetyltransferase [Halococcoides cellulosivorans]AWB27603.1 GNAT family N-acetyltransferase [Halococcoides cellulosivorans]
MEGVVVESADGDDVSAVTDLWVALADDQRAHDSHVLGVESRETIVETVRRMIALDALAVARRADTVVGFVAMELERDGYDRDVTRGRVPAIYVRPDDRSSGIGTQLLDRAERELGAAGADVITLEALAANDRARELYHDRGFVSHRVVYEKPIENDTHSSTQPEAE